METDDLYGPSAKPEFYRLFHELVSIPPVREFFGWDHDAMKFQDAERARQFYDLIAPNDPDVPPKVKTYIDVRKLRDIVGNHAAESALFDPDETLASALAKALEQKQEPPPQDPSAEIRHFKEFLERLTVDALRTMDDNEIGELEVLAELISTRIEEHVALTRSNV